MRIFAIGDLHLSSVSHKAMDVFGPHWANHWERIQEDWKHRVREEDLVLIAGDTSWAMSLADAVPDLEAIGRMPGTKVLVRGNHDYWWSAPGKVRSVLPEKMLILQNDALRVGDTVLCGSRGWVFPIGGPLGAEDEKIFEREKLRLRMSLDKAATLGGSRLVCVLHYPPLYENMPHTDFTDILEEYRVDNVVFGHLHGEILSQVHLRNFRSGEVTYDLVSADYLNFGLYELPETVPFRLAGADALEAVPVFPRPLTPT